MHRIIVVICLLTCIAALETLTQFFTFFRSRTKSRPGEIEKSPVLTEVHLRQTSCELLSTL